MLNLNKVDQFQSPNSKWFGLSTDEWLPSVVSRHFDSDHGSQYWLDKEKELGIDARKEIKTLDDLKILGPMCEDDLRRYPIEHFIPKIFLDKKSDFILGETAGTTGRPKVTAYRREEFRAIFVDWFAFIAEKRDFPTGGNWLWIGPSGPHIIGKAVGPVANGMGSMDPFSIDFDPRWAKKMQPESIGSKRYLEHVLEQAMDIIETQGIDVLYTTPPVLAGLALRMSDQKRRAIKGVHYGGISIGTESLKCFKEENFPNAVHISGYGNTLFGLCLEIEASSTYDLDYFPLGPRMIVQVVEMADGNVPGSERLSKIVNYGEEGQVVFHRLDESFFIPNMFERDKAVRIPPTSTAIDYGITQDGVRNPTLLENNNTMVKTGLY
ncbi:coenzyme F390 synthetase [Candidatus Scalindua japonica]|uniref:Coenzyme F390 synthetase n=2 Tax=Candidatus Scalindua japonica TaxID=1284222 RepID=A0A286TTT3_9BACT|nr:coenzyme F390 synthetase [Candidatus Scalindua japonica]